MNDLLENRNFVIKLAEYLIQVEDDILNEWLKVAHISKDDPFYKEIIKNGRQTIQLITNYIQYPDLCLIIQLTKKIAKERIQANVNIGDFVYNINQGRSIVNKMIAVSENLDGREKINAILVVNQLFDVYLYHAIKEYNILKDEIIKEKNLFIKEMHNDRLNILGQIASSFAHEFRNPLTSIKGFIKLLEEKYEDNQLYFTIIREEMDSLEEKVSQFLYLSKMKGLDDKMETFNLSMVVDKMVNFMFPRFLDLSIIVEKNIKSDLYTTGVEDQIKQVILNILNNAVEELSKIKHNRTIMINLYENNGYHVLDIANNGPLIPQHLLEDIFQPFVTTKKLGVGLGLSVCKQIIEKHNGMIRVQSKQDKTTFTIELSKSKKNFEY